MHRAERHEDGIDPADAEVVRVAIAAERQRLIELRQNRAIGDAAFQQVEQELDMKELDLLWIGHEPFAPTAVR